jgi:hypothetical protein
MTLTRSAGARVINGLLCYLLVRGKFTAESERVFLMSMQHVVQYGEKQHAAAAGGR